MAVRAKVKVFNYPRLGTRVLVSLVILITLSQAGLFLLSTTPPTALRSDEGPREVGDNPGLVAIRTHRADELQQSIKVASNNGDVEGGAQHSIEIRTTLKPFPSRTNRAEERLYTGRETNTSNFHQSGKSRMAPENSYSHNVHSGNKSHAAHLSNNSLILGHLSNSHTVQIRGNHGRITHRKNSRTAQLSNDSHMAHEIAIIGQRNNYSYIAEISNKADIGRGINGSSVARMAHSSLIAPSGNDSSIAESSNSFGIARSTNISHVVPRKADNSMDLVAPHIPRNIMSRGITPAPFAFLRKNNVSRKSYCDGKITVYDRQVALLRDVQLDATLALAEARGGENASQVLGQKEKMEFYELRHGFLTVPNCVVNMSSARILDFTGGEPSTEAFQKALKVEPGVHKPPMMEPTGSKRRDGRAANRIVTTRATRNSLWVTATRYEYANVFWMVVEVYDAFLIAKYFNHTLGDTTLLMLDAHPRSSLDDLFHGLFRRVLRPSDLPRHHVTIPSLALGLPRRLSPMLSTHPHIHLRMPYLANFRKEVLASFSIARRQQGSRRERCHSNKLSALFVWRRDYLAHPRNAAGIVTRKISNEQDLLNATRVNFPTYKVIGAQLDKYNIAKQLALIHHADILVGMHGAALAYNIFMMPGGAMLEIFPMGWGSNWHMEHLATANSLVYRKLTIPKTAALDKKTEWLKVDAATVVEVLRKMSKQICDRY